MEWIRYHPKTAGAIAGLLTLFVIVVVWIQISPSDPQEPDSFGDPVVTATPTPEDPLTALPTGVPSSTASANGGAGGDVPSLPGFGAVGGGGGKAQGGNFNVPGYQGGSLYKFAPKHRITLQVTGDYPIGTIGWALLYTDGPTSGTVKNAGRSWSMSRTVYGEPDYARLFFASGAQGKVRCRITVDGKVTEERSTEGPYAQMMCQG